MTATQASRRALTGAAAAGVLLLVGGAAVLAHGSTTPSASDPVAPTAAQPQAPEVAVPAPAVSAQPAAAVDRSRVPDHLTIPALDVDADVVPIQTVGSTLTPPSDAREVGWWAAGARPGATRGSTLITGHTLHLGGGAFDDLERLTAGDRVKVGSAQGPLTYAVTRVRVLTTAQVAAQAEDLFDQTGPARLVLLTCEGWDGAEFTSTVVVDAATVAT